ncbi:hypothetical protein DM02DRAFT_624841 [Periconia macrospinosa]|uniref:Uncharacterized protein n=1 Tax=Periconia macrospinosa TaxID=97972 RepID=A0A2V1E1V7_9PLEO|nr:hypothetical protein DM02DRAFT_624841 [Periconia macrospinosa]
MAYSTRSESFSIAASSSRLSSSGISSSRPSISEITKQGKCPHCKVDPALFFSGRPYERRPGSGGGRLHDIRAEFHAAQPYLQWKHEESKRVKREQKEREELRKEEKKRAREEWAEQHPEKKHTLKGKIEQWLVPHHHHLHTSHHQSSEKTFTERSPSILPLEVSAQEEPNPLPQNTGSIDPLSQLPE